MSKKVLLIIDMLNDFFERNANLHQQRPRLVAAINELANTFRNQNQPVIWVRQEFAPDLHDAFLDMRKNNFHVTIAGTDGCEILSELDYRPADKTIVKKRYSAFFGTDLETTLESIAPEVLVVAGVNTHACVRTTVIDAYQRDYEVVVASECIASSNQEHHDITTGYLDGGIARLVSNKEIVEMLKS